MLRFTWDKNKNEINLRKHSISFLEAKTVFYDSLALIISDDEHSSKEERYILLGTSCKNNILVVVHCYRDDDQEIRIISARKANKSETNEYLKRSNYS